MSRARRRRPKVGLVQGGAGSFGGQPLAAKRLVRLLSEHVELVMLWLEEHDSGAPSGVQPYQSEGFRGWRIRSPWNDAHPYHEQVQWMADGIARAGRREGLQALHLHGAFDWPLASGLAAASLDLPLVVSYRGCDMNSGFFHQAATMEVLMTSATVSTFMNSLQEQTAHRLFKPPGQTMVIPNHLDHKAFQEQAVDIPLPRPIFGCVAEFRRVVGLDLLLQAHARLSYKRPVSLLLVGPFYAKEAPYYGHFLDNLPGRERIHRTGAVPHQAVLNYMAACDAMVFPSISEGHPNKILEAMAAGTPVVASRVAGNVDVMEDGVDGRLFEPRDAGDLERVLLELLDNPAAGQAMAARARDRVLKDFTSRREREEWLECYRKAGLGL